MASFNTVLVALLTLATAVHGFWRMECNGMAGLARIDPIVSPGIVSKHVHALFGSSNLGLNSTNEDLRNGQCTSCAVKEDKSGYWQPALYFQHANGSFEYVGIIGDTGTGNAGILAYYKLLNNNGTQETGIMPFPEGFRMIAGNSMTRTLPAGIASFSAPDPPKSEWGVVSQDILAWRALGFNCIHSDDGITPEASLARHYLPSKDEIKSLHCSGGLRTEIVFPSCWNGQPYDAANPQAHIKYPSLSEDGTCPEGFENRLPTLMYEAIWDVMKFVDMDGRFLLSNGDTTGFGMHADFMSGWDQVTLEQAVATCHSSSGEIKDCPLFTIQEKEDWEACKLTLPSVLEGEVVRGAMLPTLPGGTPITEPGEEMDGPLAINAVPSNESNSGSSVSSAAETSEPSTEAVEPVVTPTTTSTEAVSTEPTTTEAPTVTQEKVSYSVISTEYRTEGNKVYEVVWEEAWVYVTEDLTSTVTVSTSPNHMRRTKRSHFHNHQGLHRRH